MSIYLEDITPAISKNTVLKWFENDLKSCLGSAERFEMYIKYLKLYFEYKEEITKLYEELA